MKDKKPVGIWIRVSHEDSVKGESPEHHEHRARAYAEAKGWDVVKMYRLDAVSGKSVKDRPETQQMLQDVREGNIQALIFSKLARLARNTRELLDFADFFQEQNAGLISLQESIDTSSPAGRLFYTMIAALAQWEREEISSRVAASVPVRAKLGKPTGGAAPLGFQWIEGRMIINPNEAPIRKLMFELFLQHKRRRTVANLLNELGHRTRNGSLFTGTTVDRLLRDPSAKGLRRANYTKSTGEGKHWVLKSEEDWIYVEVEPIVSLEIWDQVNQIITEQRQKSAKRKRRVGRKPEYLFSGLTSCECGKKMYVSSNSPKYVCTSCRNKIPIDDLNKVFIEQLKSFLLSPDDVSAFVVRAESTVREKIELLNVLTTELSSVETKMDKVYDLYIDGEITSSGFGSRYGPLEKRQNQLQEELPRLQGEIDSLKIQYLSNDDIFSNARDFYSEWPNFSFEEKRTIVEHVVEHIEIQENSVVLELAFSPNLPPIQTYGKTATHQLDSSPR